MVYVDTNVILRYLLQDNKELGKKAKELIDEEDIFISNEVIVEVSYVLKTVYSIEKEVIFYLVMELLAEDNIHFANRSIIYETFKLFMHDNLDIIDCMLIAYHICEGRDVATFDKKLNKYLP